MWKTSFFIFLFILSNAYALPKNFEVWFLSLDSMSLLMPQLEKPIMQSRELAQSLQCQMMGEYCFDPQVGLYKPGQKNQVQETLQLETLDTTRKYENPGTATSLDRSLIDCKGEQAFDIFCGQAKETKAPKFDIEIWVDVSSTMKQIDFRGHDQNCAREEFVRGISKKCKFDEKMKIMLFNESFKASGNMSDVCINYGLNEVDRLISQIEKSDAKKLIVITDIFEAQERLINFVELSGVGSVKGITKPMYAKDLTGEVERLTSQCK